MKNNLDTPVAKQCRALYTKYAYGHTYGLLKVALCCKLILWFLSFENENQPTLISKKTIGTN